MAGIKDKAALSIQQSARRALSIQQLAVSHGKQKHSAISIQHSAKTKTTPKKSKNQVHRKRRRTNTLRFPEVAGKTVAFIEMDWSAEFPCVEVGFDDKTALLVLMGTRLTMEPSYSDWKTGNLRDLRRWPRRETDT
jgi:hypothetical protein